MNLSRVMGHSSVKVTEIYLEDVQSRQARMQHTRYSPVGDLRLPAIGRGYHRYRRARSAHHKENRPPTDDTSA